MKPPVFEYARARSVDEALSLIRQPGAKLLAGGQSLIPLLNLRLARPSLLVDIGSLGGLSAVALDDSGQLHLGALVRHQQLLNDEIVARHQPLLVQAAQLVGHVAVRNRGTLGGSLCHADPTAELGTALLALNARFRLIAQGSDRWVRAEEFFLGPFATTARDDEMLVEVVVPSRPPAEGSSYLELSQRLGDFAIVAAAALVHIKDDRLTGVRIGWCGGSSQPMLAESLALSLEDRPVGQRSFERACVDAVESLKPSSDIRGSSNYKRAVLAVLTARAVRAAVDAALVGN